MNQMKIVFYIPSLEYGGAERVMTNLIIEFKRRGYGTLVVNDYYGEKEYEIPSDIKRICLNKSVNNNNRVLRAFSRTILFRRILKEYRPDISISFMPNANVRNVIACKGLKGTKCITSVRVDPDWECRNKFLKYLLHMIMLSSDGCVFQTRKAWQKYPRQLQRKSTIIKNPVGDIFFDNRTAIRNESKKIIAVGRLSAQKNYSMLVDAFFEFTKIYPNIKLEIWGQGELEEQLQRKIKSLGIDDRVSLMGVSDNMVSVYNNCMLYIMTSDFEGLPNSLMEALVCGCPVIATDCDGGGAAELIDDGVNGYLIPKNDTNRLISRIIQLVRDDEMRKTFSKKAIISGEKYRLTNIVDEWERFIIKGENK